MSAPAIQEPKCPKCDGPMWDNRVGKRNPKSPDFKCKDRGCDGVIWPSKKGGAAKATSEPAADPKLAIVPQKSLSQMYIESADFVLNKVVPKFVEKEIGISDTSVASMIATVFIQRCRAER